MNHPSFVTFVGIDRRTDFNRCQHLSAFFPIEWGVLIGGDNNKEKYPDKETCRNFSETKGLRRSVHLCGQIGKDVLLDKVYPFWSKYRFNSFQINAISYEMDTIASFQQRVNANVIIQFRDDEFPTKGYFPPWVFPLHDKSGGRGIVPSYRPEQPAGYRIVGYAGGIKPDNVAETVNSIKAYNYWLDIESGIRTGDWFDLDKCEEVCRAIWPWIKYEKYIPRQPDAIRNPVIGVNND